MVFKFNYVCTSVEEKGETKKKYVSGLSFDLDWAF